MKQEKIIFVCPHMASFIQLDIDILSERYTVIQNTYNWKNKIAVPYFLLKQFFFLLTNIRQSKLIIVSFGGYWALIPAIIGRLFKKPVYIILHGTDCAAFPEINYGNLNKPILKKVLKISYQLATKLLPVSDSLVYTENTYYSPGKIIKQGYKHFFKNNTTAYTVIYNGIDTSKWIILPDIKKVENRFITVLSEGQFFIKGGDLIIEAAKKLSHFEFIFVGIKQAPALIKVPDNVKFTGRLSASELLQIYNSSKYYLQLSITEGFGVALCEAMACGCIPIVSNVNILPDIIGDSGYVLTKSNVEVLIKLIIEKVIPEKRTELDILARNTVFIRFSIENRKEKLDRVIENL